MTVPQRSERLQLLREDGSSLDLGGQVLRLPPNEMGWFAGVGARDQAAVELQVSAEHFDYKLTVLIDDIVLQGPIQLERLKP